LAIKKKDEKKFGKSEVQNILCGTTGHTPAKQFSDVTLHPYLLYKL
jgi:hypothetical protein